MDLQKLKAFFEHIFKRLVRAIVSLYKRLSDLLAKLFEHLPIPARFRRMAAMLTLSLLLVAVVFAAVPVFKAITGVTGAVIEAVIDEIATPADEPDADGISSEQIDRDASAPVLKQVLPETMEVPQNDIIQIPTGGTAFRFTEAELPKLQRLMVFTEKCHSFDYNDKDKDAAMALTAYRLLIETNDANLTVNPDPFYYSVRHLHLQKYINQLFGRNLSSTDRLGEIYYTDNHYLYSAKTGEPTAVSGYISEAYSLGDDFYKITGIVTRGFANESGRYSRKLSLILKKNSEALYGYYIVSVVNEPMTYTYLDSLLKTLPPDENALLHFGQQATIGNQTDSASQAPTEDTSSNVQSDEATASTPQEDTASTAPIESVTQPDADEKDQITLSDAQMNAVRSLLEAIPSPTTDFDTANESSAAIEQLTAHLLLCRERGMDCATQLTANSMHEINEKVERLFGVKSDSAVSNADDAIYRLEPYVSTGKNVFKRIKLYSLGGNRYLVRCELEQYSNVLLEEADAKYSYTAVVEKSDMAQFGFYFKSQKCTAAE